MSYVTPPQPYVKHMRRVIITNPTLGIANFKMSRDYEIGGPAPEVFQVPIATGYVAEVLDYDKTGTVFSNFTTNGKTFRGYSTATTPNTLVQYGKSATFAVVSGTNNVTITIGAFTNPTLTLPASITGSFDGSTTYNVSATIPANGPFDPTNWALLGGYSAASMSMLTSVNAASVTQTGPVPYSSGDFKTEYFLGGKFFLRESLQLPGDAGNFFSTTAATSVPLSYASGTITPP